MINYLYILIITSNNSDRKYLKQEPHDKMIRSWQDEKSQIDRTSRWLSSQTASSVHSRCPFLKKVWEEKQPSKSAAGPLLTASKARHIAASRRSARPERKDDLISCVHFFFFSTPPSDLSAARAYAYVLTVTLTCPSYAMRTIRE